MTATVTLTTGVLAIRPMPGRRAVLDGQRRPRRFCARAALEMPRKLRINEVTNWAWIRPPGLSAAD